MTTAEILDVTPDEYHERDEFSSTLGKLVIERSPLHAKANVGRKPTKNLDRGSIIHRLVLGKGKDFEPIQAENFLTKAAKEARDKARAEGKVPVLVGDLEDYCKAAESIRVQLADRGIILDGQSELAITWQGQSENGPVACRAMLDHVWLEQGLILDLKICDDASPARVERTAENLGYAIQAAAYTEALTALLPSLAGKVRFLFAFCEPDEPTVINISQPDGSFRDLGERRWGRAKAIWAECLKTGVFPAYGAGVNIIRPPAWALLREEEAST